MEHISITVTSMTSQVGRIPSWKDSVGNSNGEEQSVAFGHGKMGEDEDVASIEAEVEAQDDVETNERIDAGKDGLADGNTILSTTVSIINETDTGFAAQRIGQTPLTGCTRLKGGMREEVYSGVGNTK
ncbi:hypothetical protein LOK49_LG01G01625 [Camellia lanceoleosa]|uniref:Uncharacterized protein n=1 Tax=Camellia lanceoleosa TaxID=1840588 RepID=A0ACC0IXP8_9ERIC|nr:hypothetical protein LOK49_LG01G01625 [Camellia lanceoleosa]